MRVDIGFTPSNNAWNTSSTAELGLFLYQSGDQDTNRYRAAFLNGCRRYSDVFAENIITGDRTWKTSRIMAYVAAGGGVVATLTVWLFVLTPLPDCFVWPGVLLPALLAAFLAEGSKFLFFDTTVCRNNIWYPPGEDSLPQSASCTLGNTAKYAIGATAVFFFCLAIVCLRSPERRDLEDHYGSDPDNDENEETSDDYDNTGSARDQYESLAPAQSIDIEADPSQFSITSKGEISDLANSISLSSSLRDDDDLSSYRTNSREEKHLRTFEMTVDDIDEEDDRYNPKKPPRMTTESTQTETVEAPVVSESRLIAAKIFANNAEASKPNQDSVIDNFVRDFNASFEDE